MEEKGFYTSGCSDKLASRDMLAMAS